ncbi:hypothetical protein [Psychrobacter sp. 16-MNA-CIBAN-0192]|uniref:hypothetical protein n=1 Tax=Psychrobacter sp. 16-MNA-CIBAN-0192 TaxID=3140448 RepID=UPI0033327A8E
MKISNFQEYLIAKPPIAMPARNYINEDEQQLIKKIASLPVKSEEAQVEQLEEMLTKISVADMDDALRLRLLAIVMMAMESLIAALRKQYIYEVGALSSQQMDTVYQVESLYYLAVMVYDAIVQRESLRLQYQYQQQQMVTSGFWQRLLAPAPVPPITLAVAVYQALLTYQNLLYEKAICYQKPLRNMWLSLNQLYLLACQHHITKMDLSTHTVTRQANTIHQLYCQICLYSLLNVMAMRRPSMLLIQRLLPEWANHIAATLEPKTKTRVFIDLNSDEPPQYLTAITPVNPYEDTEDCLFIELEPLAVFLSLRQRELLVQYNALNEYRLVTKILMAISHRYINREPTTITKYSPRKRATLITGFNDIHYHVAGKRGLMSMVAAPNLSIDYLPRYDTVPRKDSTPPVFEIEINDDTESIFHFRTLRLLTAQDLVAQQSVLSAKHRKHNASSDNTSTDNNRIVVPPLNEIFEPITLAEAEKNNENVKERILATAPPILRIMSLYLLMAHKEASEPQSNLKNEKRQTPPLSATQLDQETAKAQKIEELGIIRWLTVEDEYVEAESQILGYHPTACALRLDNRDNRSENFVPALLLAAVSELQVPSSLLVSNADFKVNDKVIIRLNDKQKSLRLQEVLLTTEEFTQYEVLVL